MKYLKYFMLVGAALGLAACSEDSPELAKTAYASGKYQEAMQLAQSCSDHPECQDILGRSYYFGNGVQKDHRLALQWFEQAASAQNPYAEFLLADVLYVPGEDTSYRIGLLWDKALPQLLQRAEEGDPVALHLLGIAYQRGIAVQMDDKMSLEYFQKAAEKNYMDAYISLGEQLEQQIGYDYEEDASSETFKKLHKDIVAAYTKAAELGSPRAQFLLASYYQMRNNLFDNTLAMKWLRQSAEGGYVDAMLKLGGLYERGSIDSKVDIEQAKVWYEKAVAAGSTQAAMQLLSVESARELERLEKNASTTEAANDSPAVQAQNAYAQGRYEQALTIAKTCSDVTECQDVLARAYYFGNGTAEDEEEAIVWAKKAADSGNHYAQYILAMGISRHNCEECEGLSTTDLLRKAFVGIHQKALQGDPVALYFLGQMYDNGDGVSINTYLAAKYMLQSAAKGYVDAQLDIGFILDEGQGLYENNLQAVRWYTLAGNSGSTKAQHNLGLMYDEGEADVLEDNVKALEWYTKAANAGHTGSQNNLGVMYQDGDGVQVDLAKARMWYEKAAAGGNEDAKDNLYRLDHPEEDEPEEDPDSDAVARDARNDEPADPPKH